MPPKAKMYLRDILDAALLVRRFTEGKTFADYESATGDIGDKIVAVALETCTTTRLRDTLVPRSLS